MKILFFYLIFANILGFILFGLDKRRAIQNRWRIRESSLLAAAALGGSAGCLAGMFFFHHKTRHLKFRLELPLILAAQVGLLLWKMH